jgi:diguanylate cyclase (GGDEF)-like protein
MSLRIVAVGAVCRALLALAGLVAGVAFAAWPPATACFAAVAALALAEARSARLESAAHRRASERDPLTGVGNYRALHERLHEATAADPRRFALLTLDVDSFKAVNDAHGHLEGDRLLQEVSRVLTENVRATDVVARQGGDEFAVLVPETDESGAAMLAERIEQALASIQAAGRAPVRASIGMAMFPRDGATPDDLLEAADLRLRLKKQDRREAARAAA